MGAKIVRVAIEEGGRKLEGKFKKGGEEGSLGIQQRKLLRERLIRGTPRVGVKGSRKCRNNILGYLQNTHRVMNGPAEARSYTVVGR